jgi:hypothetical protein
MDRNAYYIAIAFFGMINGLFNQLWVLFALLHVQILAPALLFGSVPLTLMFSSLMVSTATIILAGGDLRTHRRRQGGFDRGLDVDLACRNGAADASGDRQFPADRPVTFSRAQRKGRKAFASRLYAYGTGNMFQTFLSVLLGVSRRRRRSDGTWKTSGELRSRSYCERAGSPRLRSSASCSGCRSSRAPRSRPAVS